MPRSASLALVTFLITAPSVLAAGQPGVHDGAQAGVPWVVAFRTLPDEVFQGQYRGHAVRALDVVLRFAVVEDPPGLVGLQIATALDANVRYAFPDDADAFRADATPNDPGYPQQYGLGRIAWPGAWTGPASGSNVTVAILDSGIDGAHPDLQGRLLAGWDFVHGDAVPEDDCGHGTHVAGIVGATTDNGQGIAGVAQPMLLPVKALRNDGTGSCSGSFSAVASGIRFAADQGARVISMSLGCQGCSDPLTSDAIAYAWGKGALLVASAGNAGPCTQCVGYPATHPSVMAVACTDSADASCWFSSAGSQVALAAPGASILSTYPANDYRSLSGTSMSAPFVSGVAALAFGAAPNLTNAAARDVLQRTARDVGAGGFDTLSGHGIVNASAAIAEARGSANAAPLASFTWNATGLNVSFDGRASRDPDGTVASYAWQFGDGTTGSGDAPGHAYVAAGTYRVNLTVRDDLGATSTTSADVTVGAPQPAMHISGVSGSSSHYNGSKHKVTAKVTVVDAAGAAVKNATITGRFMTPWGWNATWKQTTNGTGVTKFVLSDPRTSHGTYKFCVDAIAKPGWAYDPSANVKRCTNITTK